MTRRVDGGYLVAYNNGEFGGSLWWFDPTGTSRRRIGDARVVAFIDIDRPGRQVLAGVVEGLAHMGTDVGSVATVERDASGVPSLTTLAQLPSAPSAVGESSLRGTLVATTSGVVRIERDGTVTLVGAVDLSSLYPGSIVEVRGGSIFVGMRRFLVEINPRGRRPLIRWYTDSGCKRFRPVRPASCACL